jgi:hypothetical protein
VIVQCDTCGCKGTGQIARRLYACTIPHERAGRGVLLHRKCGGRLVAFDNTQRHEVGR